MSKIIPFNFRELFLSTPRIFIAPVPNDSIWLPFLFKRPMNFFQRGNQLHRNQNRYIRTVYQYGKPNMYSISRNVFYSRRPQQSWSTGSYKFFDPRKKQLKLFFCCPSNLFITECRYCAVQKLDLLVLSPLLVVFLESINPLLLYGLQLYRQYLIQSRQCEWHLEQFLLKKTGINAQPNM